MSATTSAPPWDLVVAVALFGLAASAFFSGCETGLMSTSRVRLRRRQQAGRTRRAGSLGFLLDRLEESILTCLVGTNLFNVLVSAVVTAALTARSERHGEVLALAVTAVATISLGEILPKVLYREFPERLTLASTPLLRLSRVLLLPVLRLLGGYTRLLGFFLPAAAVDDSRELDRRGLASLLRGPAGGEDRRFVEIQRRFLELAGTDLGRVMTPLDRMVTVDADASVPQCLDLAAGSGKSRLPVRRPGRDELVGWLLVRDLLLLPEDRAAAGSLPASLVRTCLLVDVRMTPHELFEEFHHQRRQLAVVVDARGETLGLVTLEDLIEEVMGEVRDEFDSEEQAPLTLVAPGHIVAQGALLLEEIENHVSLGAHGHDVHTVGGLVMAELGRRPFQGDEVSFGDVTIRIEAVERLAVRRVSIRFPADIGPVGEKRL